MSMCSCWALCGNHTYLGWQLQQQRMARTWFRRTSVFVCLALVVVCSADDRDLSGQTRSRTGTPFGIGAVTHETRGHWSNSIQLPNVNQTQPTHKIVRASQPTRSGFLATWPSVSGATRYLLDVSTNLSFTDFVDGYHDLDVGNTAGRVVTGLRQNTTYYYRVRPYEVRGRSRYSVTMSATTDPTTGLTIHPTFDNSILNHPDSTAIEASILAAISVYESFFNDPITIEIRFRYSTTAPNGDPLPAGRIAQSDLVYYTVPWNTYIDGLRGDAKTANDNIATASLPGSALSANLLPSSATGRAVVLDTPPAMFSD